MQSAARAGLVVFALGSIVPAAAQQTASHTEKVEVTGSSIKRIDAETSLPVQILTRQDIERTGATTTEELLKQVTAVTGFGGTLVQQANGTITTSQSNISLRALGSTRTGRGTRSAVRTRPRGRRRTATTSSPPSPAATRG